MTDPDVVHIIQDTEEDDLDIFTSSYQGEKNSPISVENYTYDVSLQDAIYASITHKTNRFNLLDRVEKGDETNPIVIESWLDYVKVEGGDHVILSDEEEEEEERVTPLQKSHFNRSFFTQQSISETGQSSNSKPEQEMIFCQICMELKHPYETFKINGCSHVFCNDCIGGHVSAKIQENSKTVRCPDLNCNEVLEPEFCRPILSPEVFERWCSVLCESLILETMRFYCPFKDCSALLVDEREGDQTVIKESECPHCWRLFCAQCKVPWHSGIDCAEFQNLKDNEKGREDIMLMNLAKKKKWQRCPMCKFYVERIDGCMLMKCRCGHCFCYGCGSPMTPAYHYCTRCKR